MKLKMIKDPNKEVRLLTLKSSYGTQTLGKGSRN